MAIALILVDIQNDFVPRGALAVPDGHQVIPVANRQMAEADYVVATQDWHPAGHASFASTHPGRSVGEVIDLDGVAQVLWPDHCVQGTPGADFCPGLNRNGIHDVVHKGTDRQVDSYSGFFDNRRARATGLDERLKRRDVRDLVILGLATDYCVKFTVLDALELGYDVRVVGDGCRAVNRSPDDGANALEEMRQAGAVIA